MKGKRKSKRNPFMYVLLNPAGIPVGQYDWYSYALYQMGNKPGFKIIKKEFINGRWQDVDNPQLTI